MEVLQATATALIALIVAPGAFFYFDVTPKIAVLLLATAAMLVWPRGADSARAPRAFSLLAVATLLSMALSAALSPNPALSLFGTNWRRYGVLTAAAVILFSWFVAKTVAARPARTRTILRGIAAAGAISALYGIAQFFGWDPILPKSAYHIGEGIWTIIRPPGTLGYVSYFATWLLGVTFLALSLAEWETTAAGRYLAWTTAALATGAMLLTGTRAADLGLVAGGVVWLFSRGFRISRRAAAVSALVVLAALGFYYSPPGWPLRSRTRWISEDRWGGARLYLWRDSLAMAARRPLGYGPEVFTAEFPRFESADLARAYPDFLHESPHNILLDAWVSEGLPGLALLAAFCCLGLAAAWRSKQPGARWMAASLAAVIVAQMFTVLIMPTALLFYMTVAIAVGLQGGAPGVRRKSMTWLQWAAALALVYCAGRYLAADRELALAKSALERGDVTAAAARYLKYDARRFPGTGSDLWFSRACSSVAAGSGNPIVRVQALGQAGTAAIRATRTSEEPFNAWYNLSALYAARNDSAGTERALRAAIEARPNWFKPHWVLAQVLRLEGRLPEAEPEASIAADRNGGKNPEVNRTLLEIRQLRGEQPW